MIVLPAPELKTDFYLRLPIGWPRYKKNTVNAFYFNCLCIEKVELAGVVSNFLQEDFDCLESFMKSQKHVNKLKL